jgi:hypothetical protein
MLKKPLIKRSLDRRIIDTSFCDSMFSRSQVNIWYPEFNRNESTNIDRVDVVVSLKIRVFEFGNGPIIVIASVNG